MGHNIIKTNMSALDHIKNLTNRAITDVIGIHPSSSGLHAVRMKKTGDHCVLAAAALLPPVRIDEDDEDENEAARIDPIDWPPKLRARYAALATPARRGAVKLLRVPESFNPEHREEVMSRMACKNPDELRFATKTLIPGAGKTEARVLASALPDAWVANLLNLIPSTGSPAARLIEASEVAVINAFHNDPGVLAQEHAYGLIHFDYDFSLIALFNNRVLSQVRTFPFGISAVLQRVMKSLNVDETTAGGVLMDGAFDISHLIEDGIREIQGQLVVCRDFMERSENCALENLHISGPAALIGPVSSNMTGPDAWVAWNPPDAYTVTDEESVPEGLRSDTWRLAVPIGLCLGLLLPS